MSDPLKRPFLLLSRALLPFIVGGAVVAAAADRPAVLVAIDAEFGVTAATSAQAIQRGAEIAAAEINAAGGVLDGRPLRIIVRNNGSVPARAAENLKELAADASVVAVMSGKHSAVVEHLAPLVQRVGIPYLNPWAAADHLADHPQPNYLFRLSLNDTWAVAAMIRSVKARGFRRLGLLLPNTTCGRSSAAAAERFFRADGGLMMAGKQWYNLGEQSLQRQYEALRQAGAQALLLVANESEGATLVNELASRPLAERLPIVSHMGVSGGAFVALTRGNLARVDFSLVQTYSFVGARGDRARRVIAALRERYGVADARRIDSPVGLAQAYDLTHLLALAIKRAGRLDRAAIRDELERIPEYRGLIKHYEQPFAPGRHEALDPGQVFIARYADDGAIVRIR